MGANFGLEHALWFAPPGVTPAETPTYRRSEAFPHRARGVPGRAQRGRPLRDDQLWQVRGDGPRSAGAGSIGSSPPAFRQPGRLRLAPMLNPAGRIVGDLSIACLAEDRYLIFGSGFAEEFHLRWFWASRHPAGCLRALGGIEPRRGSPSPGPKSRELLQRLLRRDLSGGAFKLFQVARDGRGFRARDSHASRVHR